MARMGCARRTFIGCLGCSGILILLALFFGVGVLVNQPEEPKFTSIDENMVVAEIHEEAGAVTVGGNMPHKPIRLFIGTSLADVEIVSGGKPGQVNVDGRFDEANFELEREVEEHEDYIAYHLQLKPKRSSWFLADFGDQENRLKIVLPAETPLALTVRTNTGYTNMQLGGLVLDDVDITHTSGRIDVRMNAPNPVEMDNFRLKGTMGDVNIYDVQNFRFGHARLKGTMGALRVSNSGDFLRDADIDMKVTMGQARLELPENVRLEARTKAIMGDSRTPRRQTEGKNTVVRLNGKVTMGEQKVFYRTRSPKGEKNLVSLAGLEGILGQLGDDERLTEVMDTLMQHLAEHPEAMNISKKQMDKMGKRLLEQDHLDEALRLFEINVMRHPDYAGAYDSLGEALARKGNLQEAMDALTKSLDLDADNDYTRDLLRQLKDKLAQQ